MSGEMKKVLMILTFILISAIASVSFWIAYAGGVRGIGLLGVCFFFTAGVIVVLGQLIPAEIIFSSFMGTAFSSFRRGEMPIRAT
jgi:hypothetical protein